MTKRAIYRTAIVNNYNEVIYVSDLLFLNKETAINEVKKMTCKKEEEIKTHRWIEVYFRVANQDTWCCFEKIKNDSNKRYLGILTETLIED